MKKKWMSMVVIPVLVAGGWLWIKKPAEAPEASGPSPAISAAAPTAGSDGGYKLGDRLAASNASGDNAAKPLAPGDYKETDWESLIPKSWDPLAPFKGLDMENLDDADPRAMKALQNLRASWDNAPIEPAMNGKPVRIAGFIVPIDSDKGLIRQFLLVPYFGACIHSPAPPLNQVIEVTPGKPTDFQMMEAVWISGTLEATRAETVMGNAGYRMRNATLARYDHEPSKADSQAFE